MCGICGFVGAENQDALVRMRDALRHRGPDEASVYCDAEVSLGHRRLSIIDLSTGQQPVYNEDRSVLVVFNGEIYNHEELRATLERAGHVYASHSDTETIVHAYESFGPACVERMHGMFAFVLYDRRRRLLFGARDRLGKKPLYYTFGPDGRPCDDLRFAFTSEPKAFFEHPALSRGFGLSHEGLISYLLCDYVVGSASIFEGIHRLEPGWAFVYGLPGSEREGFHKWRYWDIELGPGEGPRPEIAEAEAGNRLLELLSTAIERRLMSDVPLGVFLSGGIDSSSIVALLCRMREARQIKTFSIGFDEPSFDESPYAEAIARHFGTDHKVRHFTAAECLSRIPKVAGMLDEPFADPSILPVSMLCEFARETVTVALGGDGGDELFAGYAPFKAVRPGHLYHRFVPRPLHRKVLIPAAQCLPSSDANMALQFKVSRFLRGAAVAPEYRMAAWMGPFSLEQLRRLIPDLADQLTPEAAYAPMIAAYRHRARGGASELQRALDFFERFYLPDDILVKVDRASMMHSLEVRAPYLDTALVEFANALPDRMKLRGGVTKYLLKKAVLGTAERPGLVPRQTVHRAKKGFGIPVARWIRKDLKTEFREAIVDDWPASLDMFDRRQIAQLHQEHVSRAANNYKELWALFMLANWARNYLPSGT
ncbi:MAG TPA: asparagine synthase (glutamine-hydrolyzing) [Isosphaeraceae bacterium]|nr:asparagine synthase (glutamine-hydrolyzing) [Isosphaeraceae bacterium]